jgi:predicted ATP-grasp superfamily ATP-dependent carboligase
VNDSSLQEGRPSAAATVLLLGISELIPVGHGPFLEHLEALGWRAVICAEQIAPRLRARAWKVLEVNPEDAGAVLKAVEGLRFDAVLPLCDATVGTAAVLGKAWQLPHASPSTSTLCLSKTRLKQTLLLAGVPTPAFQELPVAAVTQGSAAVDLPPPWICKPVRSMGGSVGVFAAADASELSNGLRLLAEHYDREVLLEPLLQGTEHSLEVIVQHGRAKILSISDKVNYPGHASVVQSLQFPGPIGWSHVEALGQAVARLPQALQLDDGVLHIEFLITEAGPFLIDLSLRPGGSYNLHPIARLSTGWDYVAMLLALFRGERTLPARGRPAGCLAWHFFDPQLLVTEARQRMPALRSQPDVITAELLHDGQPQRPLLQDGDRPGFVLVLGQECSRVMQRAEALAKSLYT